MYYCADIFQKNVSRSQYFFIMIYRRFSFKKIYIIYKRTHTNLIFNLNFDLKNANILVLKKFLEKFAKFQL